MRAVSICLVFALASGPAFAQERQTATDHGRGGLFWAGLGLGLAGVTTSVLGVTVYRITDTSTGNAPNGTYQACVAQQRDPIYAGNSCGALKGKNRPILWSGVAVSALGAAFMIGGTHTRAEMSAGSVGLFHTIRF